MSSLADVFDPDNTKTEELRQCATGSDPEWKAKEVFEFIGAMDCPSRRFAELLESALEPKYRDPEEQAKLAKELSLILKYDGYEVAQTGEISGRATYSA